MVNKHLDNDLHLGLISLMLPGAKVIWCRRDPMDNGLSIFMAAMHTDVYPWSTDLTHIGHAIRMHDRLMEHWRDTLDIELLEIRYEDLVENPGRWSRKLIEFVGLEWDERCTEFHKAKRDVATLSYAQVTQPIYTSAVRRHERYAEHLGDLRRALESSKSEPHQG